MQPEQIIFEDIKPLRRRLPKGLLILKESLRLFQMLTETGSLQMPGQRE